MEIKGKIIAVPMPERGNSSRGPWTRQTVVVEYESGQFPKTVALQNMNKAEEFGRLRPGETGTFKFDIKVHEFNGKHYNDINCWAWEIDDRQPF